MGAGRGRDSAEDGAREASYHGRPTRPCAGSHAGLGLIDGAGRGVRRRSCDDFERSGCSIEPRGRREVGVMVVAAFAWGHDDGGRGACQRLDYLTGDPHFAGCGGVMSNTLRRRPSITGGEVWPSMAATKRAPPRRTLLGCLPRDRRLDPGDQTVKLFLGEVAGESGLHHSRHGRNPAMRSHTVKRAKGGPCVDRCCGADEGIVGTGPWSESRLIRYPEPQETLQCLERRSLL